jgi:hypothetical protein
MVSRSGVHGRGEVRSAILVCSTVEQILTLPTYYRPKLTVCIECRKLYVMRDISWFRSAGVTEDEWAVF